MKFTFDATNDILAAIQIMAEQHGLTPSAEAKRCFEFGVKNLFYRMNRNKKVNARNKQMKRQLSDMAAKLVSLGIDPITMEKINSAEDELMTDEEFEAAE
jgi:phage terminase small subunit